MTEPTLPYDVAMCANSKCARGQQCMRRLAQPREFQFYALFKCEPPQWEHYIPVNRDAAIAEREILDRALRRSTTTVSKGRMK